MDSVDFNLFLIKKLFRPTRISFTAARKIPPKMFLKKENTNVWNSEMIGRNFNAFFTVKWLTEFFLSLLQIGSYTSNHQEKNDNI